MLTMTEILSDYFKNEIEKTNTKYEFSKISDFTELLKENEKISNAEHELLIDATNELIDFVIKVIACCPNLRMEIRNDFLPIIGGAKNE